MRRFVLLVSCVVLVDTSLYSALTPLLPHYADRFDLSRTGAGLLLACYGAGVLLAALPTGVWASRFGPRNAVLAGLLVIALASVAFAFADNVWTLGAARVAQGLGSAATWAGALAWLVATVPAERRGQAIGTAMGAAVFGAIIGPVLGAIADFAGARATFTGLGIVVTAILLVATRHPDAVAEPQRLLGALPAFRERRLLAGLWVTILPALLFGTFALIVSFRLHDAGWRSSAIAAVFLGAAAAETAMNPLLGRLVDRRGHLVPIRAALVASIAFALALAWVSTPAGHRFRRDERGVGRRQHDRAGGGGGDLAGRERRHAVAGVRGPLRGDTRRVAAAGSARGGSRVRAARGLVAAPAVGRARHLRRRERSRGRWPGKDGRYGRS